MRNHYTHCNTLGLRKYLKIRVIEAIDDIPAKHEKLSPLYEQAMEEAKGEEELLVLGFAAATWEGALVD